MFEMIFAAIIGLAPEADRNMAMERQAPQVQAAPQVRSEGEVVEHRARTFNEVGKDNGFTWAQWQEFYARMDGFSTVNGIRLQAPLPATIQ